MEISAGGVSLAASGRKDPRSGPYEGARIKRFGICLGKGLTTETWEVEGVLVTAKIDLGLGQGRTWRSSSNPGCVAMPVPVRALFEDGTERTVLTDRSRALDTVVFESRASLREVRQDPEGRLAMVARPRPELPAKAMAMMALGWDADMSERIYDALAGVKFHSSRLLPVLGSGLFEAGKMDQAAECFRRLSEPSGEAGEDDRFLGAAWQGLINDLEGNRKRVLEHYRSAIELDKGQSYGYGALHLRIDRRPSVA